MKTVDIEISILAPSGSSFSWGFAVTQGSGSSVQDVKAGFTSAPLLNVGAGGFQEFDGTCRETLRIEDGSFANWTATGTASCLVQLPDNSVVTLTQSIALSGGSAAEKTPILLVNSSSAHSCAGVSSANLFALRNYLVAKWDGNGVTDFSVWANTMPSDNANFFLGGGYVYSKSEEWSSGTGSTSVLRRAMGIMDPSLGWEDAFNESWIWSALSGIGFSCPPDFQEFVSTIISNYQDEFFIYLKVIATSQENSKNFFLHGTASSLQAIELPAGTNVSAEAIKFGGIQKSIPYWVTLDGETLRLSYWNADTSAIVTVDLTSLPAPSHIFPIVIKSNGTVYAGYRDDSSYYHLSTWDGSAWSSADIPYPQSLLKGTLLNGNFLVAGTSQNETGFSELASGDLGTSRDVVDCDVDGKYSIGSSSVEDYELVRPYSGNGGEEIGSLEVLRDGSILVVFTGSEA